MLNASPVGTIITALKQALQTVDPHLYSLPKLVIVGSESCGKSSVLVCGPITAQIHAYARHGDPSCNGAGMQVRAYMTACAAAAAAVAIVYPYLQWPIDKTHTTSIRFSSSYCKSMNN